MGYERGRPKLWRLEGFTTKSQRDWQEFLGALPGAPPRIVCDNYSGLTNAVRARFADAELYLCEWHLRHALKRPMENIRKDEPEHREALDKLLAQFQAAFTGPSFWTPFAERCHCRRDPSRERVAEHHRPDRRGPVPPAWPARQPTSGHAAIDLAARRVHQPRSEPRSGPARTG